MGGVGGSSRRWTVRGYQLLLAAMALVAVAPLATQSFGVETPEASDSAAVIAELRTALDQTAFRLALLEARGADAEKGELGPQENVRSVAVTVGLLSSERAVAHRPAVRHRTRTDPAIALGCAGR